MIKRRDVVNGARRIISEKLGEWDEGRNVEQM